MSLQKKKPNPLAVLKISPGCLWGWRGCSSQAHLLRADLHTLPPNQGGEVFWVCGITSGQREGRPLLCYTNWLSCKPPHSGKATSMGHSHQRQMRRCHKLSKTLNMVVTQGVRVKVMVFLKPKYNRNLRKSKIINVLDSQ